MKSIYFYKVKDPSTGLYYNPNKHGNRVDPTFDKVGKRYYGDRGLSAARKAVIFCASDVNMNWNSRPKKTPIVVQIEMFRETISSCGYVQ